MKDQFGRQIDYLRISITDRCNLRCQYCMPDGVPSISHEQVLRYEEFLRLARLAAELGIKKFKVTGGEPLVRKGCAGFIKELKRLPGVEAVTITTNGVLLEQQLPALLDAGIDAVNVSLDTINPLRFAQITRFDLLPQVLRGLEASVRAGIRTKVNCVMLPENRAEFLPVASLAEHSPVDVRFIEVMPIGEGGHFDVFTSDDLLAMLRSRWPDLAPTDDSRGFGPAHYYKSPSMTGYLGIIDAVSHKFCEQCNRVRLTSTGFIKPCLYFETGFDFQKMLRDGSGDEVIRDMLQKAIFAKPQAHKFFSGDEQADLQGMSHIGG